MSLTLDGQGGGEWREGKGAGREGVSVALGQWHTSCTKKRAGQLQWLLGLWARGTDNGGG